jgi:hypothetical protein
MHLLCPAVLADAKGLSIGAASFFAFVGLLLWAFGWRWHRFWVVFAVTLTAGVVGIGAGRTGGTQVLVVGVLLSIAVGMLALEVAKITAFLSAGTAAWVAAQAVMPQAQELWAVFLCGGLIGVVLYRLWTMLATSLIGVLLFWHAAFLLLDTAGLFVASEFAEKHAAVLNGAVALVTVVGVGVQAWTGQAADAADKEKADKSEKKGKAKPALAAAA